MSINELLSKTSRFLGSGDAQNHFHHCLKNIKNRSEADTSEERNKILANEQK
jgi:hypothetical protein